MSDGGKGSAPRKQQDHEAYSSNYDVIFNRQKRLKSDQMLDKTYKDEQSESSSGHRNDNGSQDDPRSGNEGH